MPMKHAYCILTVVNNAVKVNVGETVIVREGIQVTIDCRQSIDSTNNENRIPTINWYKDGVKLPHESAINVTISKDHKLCIITNTLLAVDGQVGTSGNYTCEVCFGTSLCTSHKSTLAVCGKIVKNLP